MTKKETFVEHITVLWGRGACHPPDRASSSVQYHGSVMCARLGAFTGSEMESYCTQRPHGILLARFNTFTTRVFDFHKADAQKLRLLRLLSNEFTEFDFGRNALSEVVENQTFVALEGKRSENNMCAVFDSDLSTIREVRFLRVYTHIPRMSFLPVLRRFGRMVYAAVTSEPEVFAHNIYNKELIALFKARKVIH